MPSGHVHQSRSSGGNSLSLDDLLDLIADINGSGENGLITPVDITVSGTSVTVATQTVAGVTPTHIRWNIDGTTYQCASPVLLTIGAADATLDRLDNVIADDSNTISIAAGTAAASPDLEQPGAGEISIGFISIPNSGTGTPPSSGGGTVVGIKKFGTNLKLWPVRNGDTVKFINGGGVTWDSTRINTTTIGVSATVSGGGDFVKIAEVSPADNDTQIVISSIPQTYKHLRIIGRLAGFYNNSVGGYGTMTYRFNASSAWNALTDNYYQASSDGVDGGPWYVDVDMLLYDYAQNRPSVAHTSNMRNWIRSVQGVSGTGFLLVSSQDSQNKLAVSSITFNNSFAHGFDARSVIRIYGIK